MSHAADCVWFLRGRALAAEAASSVTLVAWAGRASAKEERPPRGRDRGGDDRRKTQSSLGIPVRLRGRVRGRVPAPEAADGPPVPMGESVPAPLRAGDVRPRGMEGSAPALVATGLAAGVIDYFFLAPIGSLSIDSLAQAIPLCMFIAEATLITYLTRRARWATERVEDALRRAETELGRREQAEAALRDAQPRMIAILESDHRCLLRARCRGAVHVREPRGGAAPGCAERGAFSDTACGSSSPSWPEPS